MHVSSFDGVFARRIRFVFLLYCISTCSSAIALSFGAIVVKDGPLFFIGGGGGGGVTIFGTCRQCFSEE